VEHPKELRAQIGKYNALISGSFALQFFERPAKWTAADMDIYVEFGDDLAGLSLYLVEQEGYIKQPVTVHIITYKVEEFLYQASASTLAFLVN